MKNTLAISRYCHGLFRAVGREKLNSVYRQLELFCRTLKDNKLLESFILNPAIKDEEKMLHLKEILKDADDMLLAFISLLIKRKHLSLVSGMLEYFQRLIYQSEGILRVKVVLAKDFGGELTSQIRLSLTKALKRKLILSVAIDKDILGGIVVFAENHLFDYSLRNQIKQLRENLLCS